MLFLLQFLPLVSVTVPLGEKMSVQKNKKLKKLKQFPLAGKKLSLSRVSEK